MSSDPQAPAHQGPDWLPLDAPLACDCPTTGLQVQVSAADLLLLFCPRCQQIVAGVPVTGDQGLVGVRRLDLSDADRAELDQALAIVPEQPLVDSLRHVLACTRPLALRVAQQRLSQRSALLAELRTALGQPAADARRLALELVARMPEPPTALRASALYAIQSLLRDAGDAESQRVALCALHPLAGLGRGLALRDDVERIRQRGQAGSDASSRLLGELAAAVLAAMAQAEAASRERSRQQRDTLLSLLHSEKVDEARALLERAFPSDDPEDPDGGMTGRIALCEAAVDVLQQRASTQPLAAASRQAVADQVRQLLSWALAAAEVFASWSTAGGEGLARMVHVKRLRARLHQLR